METVSISVRYFRVLLDVARLADEFMEIEMKPGAAGSEAWGKALGSLNEVLCELAEMEGSNVEIDGESNVSPIK